MLVVIGQLFQFTPCPYKVMSFTIGQLVYITSCPYKVRLAVFGQVREAGYLFNRVHHSPFFFILVEKVEWITTKDLKQSVFSTH